MNETTLLSRLTPGTLFSSENFQSHPEFCPLSYPDDDECLILHSFVGNFAFCYSLDDCKLYIFYKLLPVYSIGGAYHE